MTPAELAAIEALPIVAVDHPIRHAVALSSQQLDALIAEVHRLTAENARLIEANNKLRVDALIGRAHREYRTSPG